MEYYRQLSVCLACAVLFIIIVIMIIIVGFDRLLYSGRGVFSPIR